MGLARDASDTSVSHRIAATSRAGLITLVEELLSGFGEREALQVLRHPFSSAQVVELVLSRSFLLRASAVRKAVALHPAAPRADALRCLDDLGWRDLLDIGREARTPAPVRRSANQKIVERLPVLAIGERVTLARLTDRELLRLLLADTEEKVFLAVLRNSRLVTEDLVTFISTGSPSAVHLALLAADPLWKERPPVRRALLRSRRTPRGAALALLAEASRGELRDLAIDPGSDPLLAACASRIVEEGVPFVDRRRRHR